MVSLGERLEFSYPWDRLPACQATPSTGWKPIPRVHSHVPLALTLVADSRQHHQPEFHDLGAGHFQGA